jgi:transaldolase/glucose-6-phosphate isomerase
MTFSLPDEFAEAVQAALEEWERSEKVRRLWERDATLWTGSDEANWLGWLDIVEEQAHHLEALQAYSADVESGGYSDALLLGMGGSSLGPEVLSRTFGRQPLHPRFHVLDSTDPAQVRSFEQRVDLSRTLFIVASKSGTTLEPNALLKFFFDEVQHMVGPEAGARFTAITDPGSRLENQAADLGFLHVFHGVPDIGGRFSALSHFGLVPAATMGLDVARLLASATAMKDLCRVETPVQENPGAVLGAILGVGGISGRDKITLIPSPRIEDLGAWLEQLIAESTGKQGKALIPVDGEPRIEADQYGADRIFIYLRLEDGVDPAQDVVVSGLEAAGHPVVRISVTDESGLAGEFFRWEFATAVAGSIMGINPFNQPDVEASKIATRRLTSAFEASGTLPPETPFHVEDGIKLFADRDYASKLVPEDEEGASLEALLGAHLEQISDGDYFALLAYLEMNETHEEELQAIRELVLEWKGVATCLGFGPRFLHSTGQAYKGGPNSGVFLQITSDHANDVPVPARQYTFGIIEDAQARGDFEVLVERGRRALRVHLGPDTISGLHRLQQIIIAALS